ncbi:hypothetical protein [Sphingobacterium sp. IITKGP-BTPF85]|uniref:hypothetical protein n=1 Tax=Sphingobacterium sp. IITKGP-BTPF85 TaxID=1338009 RepID=UPI00038A25F2|nr:hypothetical protein [Sphingobacterium sp. IITKGP-BTPF85]KKX46971.1 hypothetical protein L950_0229035 [Sphingobacterium sp. IITKGP-BTPF85]
MLFKELLDSKYRELRIEFDKLYQLILERQTHDSDLLLVHLNGFYNPEVYSWDNLKEKMSPYMFGINHDGHSENTHHSFIGQYIKHNISLETLGNHLLNLEYSEEKRVEIDRLNFDEAISIQTEMLIYLKIWESDTFIKKFFQLANLSVGGDYDWHYKLQTTSREKGATGTRDFIIRTKIRDKFKASIPRIYNSFKNSYSFQIRNSIAHSQYSILGRSILLNNYVKEDLYSQLRNQSFEEWTERFHETLVFYTLYHELLDVINDNYGILASQMDNAIPIRISRKDPKEEIEYRTIHYRSVFKDWGWYPDE